MCNANCPPDPFEMSGNTPARGLDPVKDHVVFLLWLCHGHVGLRLFPNPDFDDASPLWIRALLHRTRLLQRQEADRHRVGMSCGFCHVGPKPPTRRRILNILNGKI
jgi:hypothetical protein